jgi:DNA mismatch endonuclease (patch repair protein)
MVQCPKFGLEILLETRLQAACFASRFAGLAAKRSTGMDRWNKAARSAMMAKVKNKNTKPEMVVRSLLHRLGFRFRLQHEGLPGRPDIILPRWKVVVYVHGCFWHGHEGCRKGAKPTSNVEFWDQKLSTNKKRDEHNYGELRRLGWRPLTVWECETKNLETLGPN